MSQPAAAAGAAASAQDQSARAVEATLLVALTGPLQNAIATALRPLTNAVTGGASLPVVARLQTAAAHALRRIRPNLAAAIARALPRAVRAGALGRRVDVDPLADPLVQQILASVDVKVEGKLGKAADMLFTPILDEHGLARVVDAADVAVSEARGGISQAVNRAVSLGAEEAARANGAKTMVWWAERDACLHCLAYSGRTRPIDGTYQGGLTFASKPLPWTVDGVDHPPLHPHCRCREVEATPLLADALRREAERSIARGFSDFASRPARLRAASKLVRRKKTRVPKTVILRAHRDLAAGQFSRRHNDRVRDVAPGRKPYAPGELAQLERRVEQALERARLRRSQP